MTYTIQVWNTATTFSAQRLFARAEAAVKNTESLGLNMSWRSETDEQGQTRLRAVWARK